MAEKKRKYAEHLTWVDTIKAGMQPIIAPNFEDYTSVEQQRDDYLNKKAVIRAGDAGVKLSLQDQLLYKQLKAQGF